MVLPLGSEPDICEGGVEAFWRALTTQWGADESVVSRPFPSPRHHIPSLTRCTDIRKKSSGDWPPPQTATCPPKSKFCTALQWRAFLFSVPRRSCRAVTVMGRTVLPNKRRDNHHSGSLIGPVWTEKTLMGQSSVCVCARERGGGGLHREVSVSWATTLIVYPCPKFLITPHLLPLSIFFSPSLVAHKAPSRVKGIGFCE